MIDFCVAVHIAEVSEKATFLLLCAGGKKVRLACGVVCSVLRCRGMAGRWLSRLDMEIPLSLTSPSRTNQGCHEVYSAECTFTHTKHTWMSGIPQPKEWENFPSALSVVNPTIFLQFAADPRCAQAEMPIIHPSAKKIALAWRRIQPHIIIVVGHPPQKNCAAKLLRR